MQFIPSTQALPAHALHLANTEDVQAHAQAIASHRCLVLHFPAWTDGRAYSQAVLLRNRLHFSGQLVASGEVLADMLPLLRRCGFSAVQLSAGQSQATAERALGFFDGHYQTAVHAALTAEAEAEAGV